MPQQPSTTQLDFQQVLKRVYDEANDRLRTDANISIDGSGGIDVVISDLNDSVAIGDGTGRLAGVSTIDGKNGLDVNVLGGEFSATGLSTGLKTQKITVTQVATKIPATPLAKRNGISVRIMGTNWVYFGDSSVTVNTGYPKFQYEEIILDIKDNSAVELYAICDAGQTCEIRVLEVA